jgi:hypothetical protein
MTPMVVWRIHGIPDTDTEEAMLARLAAVAGERYGPDGFSVDGERRRIPDHWHAHARPAGGFFDPRSELYDAVSPNVAAASPPARAPAASAAATEPPESRTDR